jgi:hypothetical protein
LARGDRAYRDEKKEHPGNTVQMFPGIAADRQESKYRWHQCRPRHRQQRAKGVSSAGGAVWRPVMARRAGWTSAWIASHAKPG